MWGEDKSFQVAWGGLLNRCCYLGGILKNARMLDAQELDSQMVFTYLQRKATK